MDPSVLAGLVDQALASGHEAVRNGNLALAEKSWQYAFNTAVQLPEDVTALRTRKVGECSVLRAQIDELAHNTAELAARQEARESFTTAYVANMEQVREEQARTGALERDQQELQDVKDYGAIGGLFATGARDLGEKAAAIADEYSTAVWAAGALAALLAVTVIVVKVA